MHCEPEAQVPPDEASSRLEAKAEALVRVEQSREIHRRGAVALGANIVNGFITATALWTSASHRRIVTWLLILALVVAVRGVYWDMHRRALGPYATSRWLRVWTLGTSTTGAVWGLGAVFLFPPTSFAGQVLLVFVVGGMVAGASASMASYPPAFVAFAVPALLPVITRLAVEGGRIPCSMAILFAFFGVGMFLIARMAGKSMKDNVRLRFRNGLLAEDLLAAREGLHQMNQELDERVRVRTRELDRAMAERDQFVAIVSHELRSPLAALALTSDLMKRSLGRVASPDPLAKHLSAQGRQLERLRRLVDDLGDVNRMAADKMTYEMQPVTLSTVLTEVLDQLSGALGARGIEVSLDIPSHLAGVWDRRRVEQVFTNLIGNAVKYGAAPISVTASKQDKMVCAVVRDHGAGMEPSEMARIFEPFVRGLVSDKTGLGLGLHIAKSIVDAHGGCIRVESRKGDGAAFIVELPLSEG